MWRQPAPSGGVPQDRQVIRPMPEWNNNYGFVPMPPRHPLQMPMMLPQMPMQPPMLMPVPVLGTMPMAQQPPMPMPMPMPMAQPVFRANGQEVRVGFPTTSQQPLFWGPIANLPPPSAAIQIRSVWADNMEEEFKLIREAVIHHPYAAIDTEFPGTIHESTEHHFNISATERYRLLKSNVDELNLIQFGLTLSDADGQLPDLGTNGATRFVWEFNFRDFNVHSDPHSSESIAFLRRHGIDFEKNLTYGVDSRRFAELFLSSGLVCNDSRVSWVAFSSGYDFGYLVKILTSQKLPETIDEFMNQLGYFFGKKVFDMKYLTRFCRFELEGGLVTVAEKLKVLRAAGSRHQAGSDSLLTYQSFHKMKNGCLNDGWEKNAGLLCGLHIS